MLLLCNGFLFADNNFITKEAPSVIIFNSYKNFTLALNYFVAVMILINFSEKQSIPTATYNDS